MQHRLGAGETSEGKSTWGEVEVRPPLTSDHGGNSNRSEQIRSLGLTPSVQSDRTSPWQCIRAAARTRERTKDPDAIDGVPWGSDRLRSPLRWTFGGLATRAPPEVETAQTSIATLHLMSSDCATDSNA